MDRIFYIITGNYFTSVCICQTPIPKVVEGFLDKRRKRFRIWGLFGEHTDYFHRLVWQPLTDGVGFYLTTRCSVMSFPYQWRWLQFSLSLAFLDTSRWPSCLQSISSVFLRVTDTFHRHVDCLICFPLTFELRTK